MTIFIVRRLAAGALLMLCASVASFSLLRLAPGNTAEAVLRSQIANDPSAAEVTQFLGSRGLDGTGSTLLWQWLQGLAQGNLGRSARTGEPVVAEFLDRFGATVELAAGAILVALVIAVPLGIASAYWRGSAIDSGSGMFALLAVSIPSFWLGLMLILGACVNAGALPCFGRADLSYLVLPAITLGVGPAAVLTRLLRSSMLEVLTTNYLRTARAKGLGERLVLFKHALRNAVAPALTILGLQLGNLLTGAVIVEVVFAWPGVGNYFVQAIFARDYAVIQGFVLAFALIFIAANVLVDAVHALIDPRVRTASAHV